MTDKTDPVLIGEIGAARGLKGELRVTSYTEDPLSLKKYSPLTDEHGNRYKVAAAQISKSHLLVRFAGIDSRDAADALRGTRLFVPRSALPPPEDEEWYISDLEGLDVCDLDDEKIGTVKSIHNYGAGDILEVLLDNNRQSLLVSFTQEEVPVVDIVNRRVVVSPLPEAKDDE